MIAFLRILHMMAKALAIPACLLVAPFMFAEEALDDAIDRRRRMRRREEARQRVLDEVCALIPSRPDLQRELRRLYETRAWR